MNSSKVRIGTRGSALALVQSRDVMARLKKKFPKARFELVIIKTTGDKITGSPLSKIGQKGLFIKEIEDALIRNEIDLAVHSLKDLPTEMPAGLGLGALLKREEPNDCLVSLNRDGLAGLERGARVGTSSLRRRAQILKIRPDLKVMDLRGNLDTRLRKLKAGLYDAVILARAGLNRLKKTLPAELVKGLVLDNIPVHKMVPAVGQGIVAVEVRSADEQIFSMVKKLDNQDSHICASAERAFMAKIEGGCQVPAGALAVVSGRKLTLSGMIASLSGSKVVRGTVSGPTVNAAVMGQKLGAKLLSAGGRKILDGIRN